MRGSLWQFVNGRVIFFMLLDNMFACIYSDFHLAYLDRVWVCTSRQTQHVAGGRPFLLAGVL